MAGLFLGSDIGTGGVRACAIGAHGAVQGFASAALPASRQQRRPSPRRSSSSCLRSSQPSRRITTSPHIGLGELANGASKPEQPTGLDHYLPPEQGERFQISDPSQTARIAPRPAADARFFPPLEAIASVEAVPSQRLARLRAPPLRRVISIGGGGNNSARVAIRRRILGVSVTVAEQTEASYGAALLALHGGPP